MPGLFHTLNVGSESLKATRQGVDTSGHNIANAQVEGYSRQRVNLKQRDPLQVQGLLIGSGAYASSITRAHDRFVEKQLNIANQRSGAATARAQALKVVELTYSPELNAGVADEITKFFNSLQDLTSVPDDFTVRTSVVEAGRDVAAAFRRIDADLKTNRAGLNEQVHQLTIDVSDKLREIADLNIKIQTTEAGQEQSANDLRDQRDRLLRDVSEKIEVTYYEDQHGMVSIRGPNQVTLVDGGHACTVGVAKNSDNDGLYDITITDWEGKMTRNVTRNMDGGALHAMIEVRDRDLPQFIAKNNEMAYAFAQEFNQVHRQGFGVRGYGETTGLDFFAIDDDPGRAALSIDLSDVIATSNDAISTASTALAPGDNVNLNHLIKIKDAKLLDGGSSNLNEYYGNYVGEIGLSVVRADHTREAHDIVVEDLRKRRDAVSGVSLDEEATNMLKWQANFTASSKLITTVDEMLETVLSLKR